MFEFIE